MVQAQRDSLFLKKVNGLPYRWLSPARLAEGKRYPLVVFLHGSGERGTDNEKNLLYVSPLFLLDTVREKFPCFVLLPQCPLDDRWSHMENTPMGLRMQETPSAALAHVARLIDQVVKENPIDTRRIYIGGLSMGGYGTWEMVARYPRLFAAAFPICGGADITTAPQLRHLPIWAFHGALDAVVPADYSRTMIKALRQAHGKPRYTEYPLADHNSWVPALAEPELLPWLFSNRR